MPAEAGVDEPGGGVRHQPQAPQRALALQPGGEIVGQGDDLVRAGEDELPGVEDERLVALRLHEAGQVGLLDGGVDVGVPVILEHPEVAVEAHIDARRLHHRFVVRVDPHPPCIDLGPDVFV